MAKTKITRRRFMTSAGGAAVSGIIVSRHGSGGPGSDGPSDKVYHTGLGNGLRRGPGTGVLRRMTAVSASGGAV